MAAIGADADDRQVECDIHEDVVDAVRWQASSSPEETMAFRNAAVKEIEKMTAPSKKANRLEEMLEDSDDGVRGISKAVNLLLLEWLLDEHEHPDGGVVKLLTEGAQLVGELSYSGAEGNKGVARGGYREVDAGSEDLESVASCIYRYK